MSKAHRFGAGLGGAGCLLVFGLFWSCITLAFDGVFVWSAYRQIRALGYRTTNGVIQHSEVEEHGDSDGDTYLAEIRFTYRVNGVEYRGEHYRYGAMASGDGNARRVVAAFPVGAEVPVYYHPRNPADAVLRTGLEGADLFLPMFMLPFNAVMLGLWFGVGSSIRRHIKPAAAGGARIRDDGVEVRVRIPHWRPFFTGFIAAAGLSFVGTFVVGFSMGFNPPLPAMLAAWAVIAGGGYWAARVHRRKMGPNLEVVIDRFHQTVTLPRQHGRDAEVVVPVERITAVEVEEIEKCGSEGGLSHRYCPTLVFTRDDGVQQRERLAEYWDEAAADSLAAWFRQRLGIG